MTKGKQSQSTPVDEYARQVLEFLKTASYVDTLKTYDGLLAYEQRDAKGGGELIARVGRDDRYFLFIVILRRVDALYPKQTRYGAQWLFERCREVEEEPDGYLDIWSRDHYKSSLITFAGSIQEIVKNSEITIGLFSHTRKIAQGFAFQIQREAQENANLHKYYPGIFWSNPQKESPCWSLENGLLFKRKGNPKEKTIEAWGLVDGQPISKHFQLMIYDDVVTEASVSTADQILKTTKMWELSRSLSSRNVDSTKPRRAWHIGTRYGYLDTYGELLRKGIKPRIYPATKDGSPDGGSVFLSRLDWDDKKRENDDYNLACQYLCNPLAGEQREFDPEWIRRWEVRPETLNIYILCDPAGNEKKDNNCNTAFGVVGVDGQLNKYLLDGACHKMGLAERWTMLKNLRAKWMNQPGIQCVSVGYERYGMQSDIEHFKEMMKIEQNHFPIEELNWPREGAHAKDSRIRRLIPDHKNWRFFYPYVGEETALQNKMVRMGKGYLVAKPIKRKNHQGQLYDVVEFYIKNEYNFFPATTLKDFMDMLSRIYDIGIVAPSFYEEQMVLPDYCEA